MASIVLSSAGTALGNQILPGLGGRILSSFGRQAGKWADTEIGLRADTSAKDGPRLESLRVQDSRYGTGIPFVFGRVRVAGNIIWASSLIETSHESQTSGGKGGVVSGAFSSNRTTYSYSVHCAIAIAAGEIGGIATIWADSKVIYQNGVWKDGVVGSSTFYNGTATQDSDPLLESMIGSGQVPAYRGLAYVVLESLQLRNFGNRLPNLTFEVLPAVTVPEPKWLGDGSIDAGFHCRPGPLRCKGMPPIVTEGNASRARRMLLGGYDVDGGNATFNAVEYDVTGDSPFETARAQSESFSVCDVGDHSWAMAPDGRFVAYYLQNIGAIPSHRFVLYDREGGNFGAVLPINLELADDAKQIAWLDAQRFVVTDVSGVRRGVHVFARAGSGIVDLGFFDVWGANTAGSRVPLYYTQFIPMAGGLLNIMADTTPNFTALYARPIVWQGNAITAGAPYTIISGYDLGTGNGDLTCLLRTDDDEWTLFHGTVIDMIVVSFRLGTASAIVTRPRQRLTNGSFSVGTTAFPVVFGNRIVVVQRSSTDNYYRLSEIALNSGNFELVTDGVVVANFSQPVMDFAAAALDGARLLLMGLLGFDDRLEQIGIIRRCNTGDMLDNVAAGILNRAGYTSADYDVSALADVALDGYTVPDTMSVASALGPLQLFEPFDLVESGAQLRAIKHGAAPVLAILAPENRATDKLTDEALPLREQMRAQELDLPLEIRVDYIDASREYEVGSQRARRSASRGARFAAKIALPLVCTAAKAKQIAETRLFAVWAEREHVRLRWSRRWLAVESGDVIDLGDRLMRVTKIRQSGGLLDVLGILVPPASAASSAQADTGETPAQSALELAASTLYLMDLPLLRAADDQPGVYAAVSGLAGWPGASLWRAADGVNYGNLAGFSTAATAGIAATGLPNSPAVYMDRASTVNVQLLRGTLASCGDADLLNGANAALLGDEIIQFQTATLLGPGLYALSNLLRGRRGTESATGSHIVGERFVLLTEGALQFVPALLTDRGRTYDFRALSNGQALGNAHDVEFAYSLLTLRPLAPVHVAGNKSGGIGSDMTISWKRRARKNGDWIDNVDVPLDEPSELYDVEIMNGDSAVRTFSNVTEPALVYAAAQQSADWGGNIPAQFAVNVCQLSARYGRGEKASAAI
ncbi:MAG: phage tail protein [Alphaproteobacteria bacterium]|nr:phage tail protein [Alphaproteobacteria bacterium]